MKYWITCGEIDVQGMALRIAGTHLSAEAGNEAHFRMKTNPKFSNVELHEVERSVGDEVETKYGRGIVCEIKDVEEVPFWEPEEFPNIEPTITKAKLHVEFPWEPGSDPKGIPESIRDVFELYCEMTGKAHKARLWFQAHEVRRVPQQEKR